MVRAAGVQRQEGKRDSEGLLLVVKAPYGQMGTGEGVAAREGP